MPARMSESFILQTYPFREADLVVSFFTRDQGKLRGVARRARRPKSSFGSGLERLSHATVSYFQKENRELVSMNSCELLHSQFALASNFETSVALEYLRDGGNVWTAVTYFALWAVRLGGFLPDVRMRDDSLLIAQEMLLL